MVRFVPAALMLCGSSLAVGAEGIERREATVRSELAAILDGPRGAVEAQSAGGAGPVSRGLGLLPGLYQWKTGHPRKGLLYGAGSGLALGTAAAMGALCIYYGNQAEDWRGDYRDLPPGLPQSEYDLAYDTWKDFEDRSDTTARVRDIGLVLLGTAYAANWFDVLTSPTGTPTASPAVARPFPLVRRDMVGIALLRPQ